MLSEEGSPRVSSYRASRGGSISDGFCYSLSNGCLESQEIWPCGYYLLKASCSLSVLMLECRIRCCDHTCSQCQKSAAFYLLGQTNATQTSRLVNITSVLTEDGKKLRPFFFLVRYYCSIVQFQNFKVTKYPGTWRWYNLVDCIISQSFSKTTVAKCCGNGLTQATNDGLASRRPEQLRVARAGFSHFSFSRFAKRAQNWRRAHLQKCLQSGHGTLLAVKASGPLCSTH